MPAICWRPLDGIVRCDYGTRSPAMNCSDTNARPSSNSARTIVSWRFWTAGNSASAKWQTGVPHTVGSSLFRSPDRFVGLGFQPRRRLWACASSDGVRLWDVAAKREVAALRLGKSCSVVFLPDGRECSQAAIPAFASGRLRGVNRGRLCGLARRARDQSQPCWRSPGGPQRGRPVPGSHYGR